MNKATLTFSSVLLACAVCAPAAAETGPTKFVPASPKATNKFTLTTELTDYSKAFGTRRETTVESVSDFGATSLVLSGSQAKRKYAGESYSALRFSGTLYHDWSDRFYTRTSIAASSNEPVFAKRELAQDFNYKILPNAVVTAGAKYAEYFGGAEAVSWSAGGSYYFSQGFVSYRFSAFDVSKLGNSHGHLVSARLRDGKGAGMTQLWLGAGSSLHEREFLPDVPKGKYRSVTLQRVQPIKGPVALSFGIGRTWYDTGVARYNGTNATVGLTLSGWPKL